MQAVTAAGRRAIAIQGDMAREADIDRTFATIDKELGRLTHLVYNAGTTGGNSRVEAVEAKTIRDTLELNVRRRAAVRQGRDPAHVDQAWRAGRRDGADLVDGRERSAAPANMSGMRPRRARSTP